ncbi:unnamed protein product [Zymoseptoria tritici ST99CH_3D1]|uniref:Uncharacterized protein n=1 Tax=Zymoseptoria tritici (strain ST99CH_3D7) TaxID=1276538 RepID=A0A1X7RZP1_ZYMT9|nr:unnamed protein product [Zymoseptoria tritici ST99CH_3D7]SMR58101.1 unnamed protein product [Zymoseptoria tritici ST99CH_3D1]
MDEQTFRLMATRLPLELVYKIYGGLTLPKTLDLVVSNSIPSSEQDRIQCTNAEAWQGPISMLTTFPGLVPMVRADISADIQAPHRDDAHSLNLRIEQMVPTRGWCMIKHSSRTTVPHDLLDLILSRFSRIKVHLLYSTDPERYSRGRLGGTLTFTYQRSSSDVWYFPDISQQGHSYYNNNFILPFRSSKIEKRVARAVEKSARIVPAGRIDCAALQLVSERICALVKREVELENEGKTLQELEQEREDRKRKAKAQAKSDRASFVWH